MDRWARMEAMRRWSGWVAVVVACVAVAFGLIGAWSGDLRYGYMAGVLSIPFLVSGVMWLAVYDA